MDSGVFTLFIKLVQQEYGLSSKEVSVLKERLLGDDRDFERANKLFRARARGSLGGKDPFRELLNEILS